MLKKIEETAAFLQSKTSVKPTAGIILGTGLSGLGKEIDADVIIDYKDIPNFPVSTVEGHHGQLVIGHLGSQPVVAMKGRFHFYEGYDMSELVFPVRVMKKLGISHLFLSNACGGVNPDFEIGDLMIITDHINLFPDNPLMGPNNDEWGRRFPDMSQTYDRRLREIATKADSELGIGMRSGVYAGLTGPCLET